MDNDKLAMLKEVRKKATDPQFQKSLDEKIKIIESQNTIEK